MRHLFDESYFEPVLTDLTMSCLAGIERFRKIKLGAYETLVILISGQKSLDLILQDSFRLSKNIRPDLCAPILRYKTL